MKIDFTNQKILITGGTGNLGNEIINLLIKNNAIVYATSTNKKFVQEFNKNNKNNNIHYYELDFTKTNTIKNFVNKINKIKDIDILINNAGINIIDSINEIKIKDWKDIQNINLTGPFLIMNTISKMMIKNQKGNILNIASIFGSVGKEKRSSYSSSKWGLIGLSKSASLDLAKYNIIVNSLSPGVIDSKLTRKILGANGIKKIKKLIPLGRLSTTKEISNIILFLISNKNTYLTGQNVIVDGGYTCG